MKIHEMLIDSVEEAESLKKRTKQLASESIAMYVQALKERAKLEYGIDQKQRTLLITYDINRDQLLEEADDVNAYLANVRRKIVLSVLKRLGAKKLGRSTYVLSISLPAKVFFRVLSNSIKDTNDELWVFELNSGFGGTGKQSIENWIEKNIPKNNRA